MIETVISEPLRDKRVPTLVALALCAFLLPASAQQPYPSYPGAGPGQGPAAGPGGASRNPVCIRLEGQLATVDRGNFDPAKAAEIKRLEDAANRQQVDLDRVSAQAKRMGCEGRGFFSLFSGQPQQCGPINNQMQQMRANLDRVLADIQRLQGNSADREGQRRAVLAALGQNDCGPQYRAFANRGGGFFENLFAPGTPALNPDAPSGNTYRTVCVRTCDGYYFPISYSTVPGKFSEDEKICQAMCPAAEVVLFSHRNPGEDMARAVSAGGRNYSELPNAFAYRKAFNPECSCKGAGQTWQDALKHLDDQTVERGDIVVNEERAKALSLPQTDAQGKPIRPPARPNAPAPKAGTVAPATATAPLPDAAATAAPEDGDPGKRQVRTVGPTFLPVR
ncbi:MAG: hypothetical protein QOC56_804 [Alphaproteobacteria bacterium]|jgi:hypothetical protein|nr:hypothetical protein [Alphaproteobacteria bacterium]